MKYFLLSVIVITLTYTVMIHPFEIPDENAHFSSLNFFYNEGRMPTMKDANNLSIEERDTERILGIMEHENLYSYHPNYRIEQITGRVGKYESEIKNLNTPTNRTTYTVHQSALYPPLYYILTLPFFNYVAQADILTRLFVSRLSSVIFTTITIFISYLFALEIFKKKSYALTIGAMILLYPMTTYVGSGVNSDNLHNLLFAVATLLAVKLINTGLNHNLSIAIGVVIGFDLITKPQAYTLFPIFCLALLIGWKKVTWKVLLKNVILILIPIIFIAGWQEIPKFIYGNSAVGGTSYLARVIRYGGVENLKIFFTAYIRTHATEMLVWYWGVFKWFGIIMPHAWWWLANRLIGFSIIGIFIGFINDIRNKKFSLQTRIIVFSILANIIYIAALGWFDWQFYQEFGRSLGLQPRHYMPLLISQMFLIFIGLTNLGWNITSKEWIRRGIIIFFLGLQLTSFYVQLNSYYDLLPIHTFIDQLSQYKPIYAKGNWWYLWFALYFTGIITSTTTALKSEPKS